MTPSVEVRSAVIHDQRLTHPIERRLVDRFEQLESRAVLVLILPHGVRAADVTADVTAALDRSLRALVGTE